MWQSNVFLRTSISNSEYKDYYVDVEYNKNSCKIKTIMDYDEKIININCDLIVHSRGNNVKQDNLIAIEMKKSTGKKSEKEKDRIRLRALTRDIYDNIWAYDGNNLSEHVCRYKLGIYYEINMKLKSIYIEYYGKFSK